MPGACTSGLDGRKGHYRRSPHHSKTIDVNTMSGTGTKRGRAWSVVETFALCVAARNTTEMGGTNEKELEARVRANFKERMLYLEAVGEYPSDEAGLPSAAMAVEDRLSKGASL